MDTTQSAHAKAVGSQLPFYTIFHFSGYDSTCPVEVLSILDHARHFIEYETPHKSVDVALLLFRSGSLYNPIDTSVFFSFFHIAQLVGHYSLFIVSIQAPKAYYLERNKPIQSL